MVRRYGRDWAAERQFWAPLVGLALVLVEGLAALVGAAWSPLSAATLVLAPGLALYPFLPRELGPLGRRLAVPVVGCAAASVLLISAATVGVPLTGLAIRVLLGAVALGGALAAGLRLEPRRPGRGRSQLPVALALAAILCFGVALQARVIGGDPVPGNDWGRYLRYSDEIARHHKLDLENSYWMRGDDRFRDDPGGASLYGGFLVMSGAHTSVLRHGIWVFALLAIVSVFLLGASLGGPSAGLGAAAVYAAIPMNITMLGWHGLSNVYAFCLLPLVVLAGGWALRSRAGAGRRWAFLLALVLVALAAAHRLTFLVAVGTLVVLAAAGLVRPSHRRGLVRFGLITAAWAVPVGLLVAVDLRARSAGTGGVLSYKNYLASKIDLGLAASDLTFPVTVAGLLGLALLLRSLRSDRALLALYGLLAAVVTLGYGWIAHLPTVYYRLVYFMPLVMAVAIGVAATMLARSPLRRGRLTVGGGAAVAVAVVLLTATTVVVAHDRGPTVRQYYEWVSPTSLEGLSRVQELTQPGDVIVTDRCWAFLAVWLLERRILAGLDPIDILPRSEERPAAQAREILYGPPAQARGIAARNRARYVLVNPTCADPETGGERVPRTGTPIYVSTRLVVLDLAPRGRGGKLPRARPEREAR